MFQPIVCPNCGAAISNADVRLMEVAQCAYCKASFRVPRSFTPEPDLGDLLLGADFGAIADIPGWQRLSIERTRTLYGPPPALLAEMPESEMVHYVLQSSGLFDDFDASVSIRFMDGALNYIRAGLVLRYSPNQGGYVFFISPQRTYMLGFYHYVENKIAWGGELIGWTEHTALQHGLDVVNRLRVVLYGQQCRVYFNGVLATALHLDQFNLGQVRLGLEPTSHSKIAVSFSDLQLREVPPEIRRR